MLRHNGQVIPTLGRLTINGQALLILGKKATIYHYTMIKLYQPSRDRVELYWSQAKSSYTAMRWTLFNITDLGQADYPIQQAWRSETQGVKLWLRVI